MLAPSSTKARWWDEFERHGKAMTMMRLASECSAREPWRCSKSDVKRSLYSHRHRSQRSPSCKHRPLRNLMPRVPIRKGQFCTRRFTLPHTAGSARKGHGAVRATRTSTKVRCQVQFRIGQFFDISFFIAGEPGGLLAITSTCDKLVLLLYIELFGLYLALWGVSLI